MTNIFSDYKIYPHEGKIKNHFKDFYDVAFVAFLPFFKVDILSSSNKNFATEKEIFDRGQAISWNTVINGAGLNDYSELNKALRSSIGASRQVFRKPELVKKLNLYTSNQGICYPTEGKFDIFSKVAIFNAFKMLDKNEVILTDEFYETNLTLELDKLTAFDFVEKVRYKDYFIYSSDKELLFTIEWDSFFFLIATGQEKMNKIISTKLFEGFLCNKKTEHTWDYEEGEIQKYLELENKQTEQLQTQKKKNKIENIRINRVE